MKIISTLMLTLVTMLMPMVAGSHSVQYDPVLRNVITAFDAAQKDKRNVDAAYETASGALKARPNDPIAMVYKGSLATQIARDAYLPWNKLGYLKLGVDLMDQAMDVILKTKNHNEASELEVRMVRGITNAQIPTTFGRGGVARDDFHYIVSSNGFKSFDPSDKATVYAWLAVFEYRDGQEKQSTTHLQLAQSFNPTVAGTIWGKR